MRYQDVEALLNLVEGSDGRIGLQLATQDPETIHKEPDIADYHTAVDGPWLMLLHNVPRNMGIILVAPDDLKDYDHDIRIQLPPESGSSAPVSGLSWIEMRQVLRDIEMLDPRWSVLEIAAVGRETRDGFTVTLWSKDRSRRLSFKHMDDFDAALAKGGALQE